MPEFENRIHQWFLKRCRGSESGKVLTKGVMGKLCAEVVNDPIAIRKGLMRLLNEGRLEYTPDTRGEPISAYVTVIRPKLGTPDHVTRWTRVLQSGELNASEIASLATISDSISELSESDMVNLLDGLKRLRTDQNSLVGQPTYLVSARYLLGSSKLLTGLQGRPIKAFGIDTAGFQAHPPYIVVGGCGQPDTVVLVENPAAFELAMTTKAVNHCAFITTFGFGLSNIKNEYGNQLAGVIENKFQDIVGLSREGSVCRTVKELLAHPRITFWGDLDPAGVQIYLRLKRRISGLMLSALYNPMVEALAEPKNSHPYFESTGKRGQIDMQVACPDQEDKAKWLLGLSRERGVDQESVMPEDICRYAALTL